MKAKAFEKPLFQLLGARRESVLRYSERELTEQSGSQLRRSLLHHTAASIHAHIACAVPQIEHVEYFYDHARIEHMLFAGALEPVNGELRLDPSQPGLGLEFKRQEAEKYRLTFS